MNRALAALVLAAVPAVAADAADAGGFAVPGVGNVPQGTFVALLSNFIADRGCTLDLSDSAATTQAVVTFVALEIGVPDGARAAALPVIDNAIGYTFDEMLADGLVMTDPGRRTASLVECEP